MRCSQVKPLADGTNLLLSPNALVGLASEIAVLRNEEDSLADLDESLQCLEAASLQHAGRRSLIMTAFECLRQYFRKTTAEFGELRMRLQSLERHVRIPRDDHKLLTTRSLIKQTSSRT